MTERQQKILGGLLGASVGDAMGAATEVRSIEMIKEKFGGYVKDIIDPPSDTYANWAKAGQVTDDFSVSYYIANEIIENDGVINKEVGAKAVLKWIQHPLYSQCAGPTTRAAVDKMQGKQVKPTKHDRLLCVNSRASNGAAMKVGCVGLFNPGKLDQAIDDAIQVCIPTHDNTIALSGATAIAAATAEAMKDKTSYYELLQAGIYGAIEGYNRSLDIARPVAGASVEKRIYKAIEIGLRNQGDYEKAMHEIANLIGGGLPANEAVPSAFGYIAATKGNTMNTIFMAVNAGDDTDTVACMSGYIVGAFNGVDSIPSRYLELIDRMNDFDLKEMALNIDKLTK